MMPDSTSFARLARVVADTFSCDPAKLTPDTVAADVDGWDSVSHAMLVMNLEDAFEFEVSIEETMAAENLGELDMIIQKQFSS